MNVAIGLVIEVILIALHSAPAIVAAQNWAVDTSVAAATEIAGPPSNARRITVIDVDDETWRSEAWGGGEPALAPRPELAKLVQFAVERGARDVVIDVIVEGRTQPGEEKLQGALAPRALRGARVYLVRTVRDPLEFETNAPQLRASPLDEQIEASAGQLRLVAPYLDPSPDGVVRDWILWRAVCTPKPGNPTGRRGHWQIVPSVQLALAAERARVSLQSAVPRNLACDRGGEGAVPPNLVTEAAVNDAVWRWLKLHPAVTRHQVKPPEHEGLSSGSRIYYREQDPPKSGYVSVVRALDVLTDHHKVPGDLSGRIVIIGQSSEGSNDRHATPLGNMPGALVIANSILSLEGVGVVREPPKWFKALFIVGIIVLVGWAFAITDSLLGLLLSGAIVLPIVGFLHWGMLEFGYWLDFAVPLIGIYAHRVVAAFEEYLSWKRIEAVHDKHT